MITPEKVEEWIKEVEERPSSAPLIIQYIANRLRDLSNRNEDLLAENIALLSGKRVEEYERRITHLEYQLDLLKRQLGEEGMASIVAAADQLAAGESGTANRQPILRPASLPASSVLVYNAQGHILRVDIEADILSNEAAIGYVRGELMAGGEPPRMLVTAETEELLFIFSSGRVAAIPVSRIAPASKAGDDLDWGRAPVPDEPRAGETLVCLTPISRLALADSFLQVSRRGLVKKIKTAMAQSILTNHYIGTGVKQALDKTLSVVLCGKDERLILVSREGYLLCLDAKGLPFSSEEAIRLGVSDHLAEAFVTGAGRSVLVVTQIGKVIQFAEDSLEMSSSMKVKGQAIFSQQRREKGIRVIGASAAVETDWGVAVHRDGQLTLHAVREMLGSGTLPVHGELVVFTTFSPATGKA